MRKTVLVGISSGIAAYKTLDLIEILLQNNLNVEVIMTVHASHMVPTSMIENLTKKKVHMHLFKKDFNHKKILSERKVDHIELADKTDLMVIIPATANVIAKLSHGIADDFLTTTFLEVTSPVILCPSMNVHMWTNPITQENVSRLKNFGYQIVEPTSGMLACGYEGEGRLEDIQIIKDEILANLKYSSSLKGKKIIVTSGGTKEKIDDIRYITNRSSGKMGAALADTCYQRGGDVLLLRAKGAVKTRFPIPEKTFETADELFSLIKQHIQKYDICYHVAAVSDFKVDHVKGKISSKKKIILGLKPRMKILDQIKKLNSRIRLIGFKAEFGLDDKALIKAAYKKLKESKADLIIANNVGRSDRGFQADMNEVIIVRNKNDCEKILLKQKKEIAENIVNFVEKKSQGSE